MSFKFLIYGKDPSKKSPLETVICPFSPCVVFLKRSPRLLREKTDLPAALGSFFDPAPLQQVSMLKYKPSGLPLECCLDFISKA
jgi:hypothetical protein